jgi:uncharacterized protein with FMN-binding domain
MKKLIKILLAVVLIFVVVMGGSMIYLTMGLNEGKNVVINGIDLTNVEDGTYTGSYEGGRWTNTLQVTVKDHRITGIKVVKDVAFSKPELSEDLFSRVVDAQNTKVDVVSQATVTSKAYLKAIEAAIK